MWILVLNIVLGIGMVVPLYIIMCRGNITVYYYGVDHTELAKYVILLDGLVLLVVTVLKYKQLLGGVFSLGVVLVQTGLHSLGLLLSPQAYRQYLLSRYNNENGYCLLEGLYVGHNWTGEEIVSRLRTELERKAGSRGLSLSVGEQDKIIGEGLEESRVGLEEGLRYIGRRVEQLTVEKENSRIDLRQKEGIVSWNDWIYNSLTYCKNGLLWSFSSEGYYIGYIVLGGASLLLGYYYRTGKIIEASRETNEGIRDLIKGNKDLAEALKQTNAAVGLVNAEVRKLGGKVSSLESFQQTQHGINEGLTKQLEEARTADFLARRVGEANSEGLTSLSAKIVGQPCLQYQEGNQGGIVSKSILNVVDEVNKGLTTASRNNTSALIELSGNLQKLSNTMAQQESSHTASVTSLWDSVLKLDDKIKGFDVLKKLVEQEVVRESTIARLANALTKVHDKC